MGADCAPLDDVGTYTACFFSLLLVWSSAVVFFEPPCPFSAGAGACPPVRAWLPHTASICAARSLEWIAFAIADAPSLLERNSKCASNERCGSCAAALAVACAHFASHACVSALVAAPAHCERRRG